MPSERSLHGNRNIIKLKVTSILCSWAIVENRRSEGIKEDYINASVKQ